MSAKEIFCAERSTGVHGSHPVGGLILAAIGGAWFAGIWAIIDSFV